MMQFTWDEEGSVLIRLLIRKLHLVIHPTQQPVTHKGLKLIWNEMKEGKKEKEIVKFDRKVILFSI